jgi:VanZ family protein
VDPCHTPSRTPASERLALWGPVVLYCALIFALSSVSTVPPLPAGMSDKTAHAILYSGLGLLVARALAGGLGRPVPLRVVVLVLVFAALYGLSDEFHQRFVPHREFDLKDMAADVVGGGLGAGLLWLWGILRRSLHDR